MNTNGPGTAHFPGAGVQPGCWCEVGYARYPGDEPDMVGSAVAGDAAGAVRWIRINMRVIVSGLHPEQAQVAFGWLHIGHRRTEQTLASGRPVALTVRRGSALVIWTARPVLFLPLAHRQAGLPPCAERFTP